MFCYIHWTFTIREEEYPQEEFLYSMKGLAPISKQNSEVVVHRYYQWVNLVLFFQACSFYLPRYLWSHFEGKTIFNLQQQLNNPVIEEEKREQQLFRVVKYLTVSKS